MAAFQKPPTVSDDYRAIDIYRQAAKIIFEKGFEATSMADIAEAVDLTKGGLYYYIKGKKALLFAIMNFAMDLIESEVIGPAEEETSPRSRLARIVSGHVKLVIDESSAMTILVYEEEGLDENHRAKIVERKKAYADFVQATIADVVAEHKNPTIDPFLATYSLLGMVHWVVRWFDEKSHLTADTVVQQVTHLALNGLLEPGTS